MQNGTADPDLPQWREARVQLEQATSDPALRRTARRLLWDFCQMLHDPAAALRHLHEAIAENPLFTRPHLAEAAPVRSVLMLATPGDYQANLPLDRLFDETTLLHTLWIADPVAVLCDPAGAIPADLPPIDCVFIAIGEDARHGAALRAADALAAAIGRPTLNCGERIERLSRAGVACLLGDIQDAMVPIHQLLQQGEDSPIAFPIIIRPRGSHAGDRLERVANREALRAYTARHPDVPVFTVAPFVDYRSPDGLWRKYRVIFVDGVPHPLHLAIHDDWAVWYYNAAMHLSPDKLAEEQRFLRAPGQAMPSRAIAALRQIANRVGLDYFGVDCSVLPDGKILVFEVETGMIVQASGSDAGGRIRDAMERMIARRLAGSSTVH